jgi:membrane peptidoglycan carboxypeptidase
MGKVRKFKVFTDGMTYEAIQAMKGNVNQGTGTAARLNKCVAAGKTGTTSGFKDAWFGGMTRGLNTAVWVGYPGKEGRAMENVPVYGRMFGGTAPALIFKDFMEKATKGTTCSDWPKPKTPFVAQPFFGKLSKSPPPGSTSPSTRGSLRQTISSTRHRRSPRRPPPRAGHRGASRPGRRGAVPPQEYAAQPAWRSGAPRRAGRGAPQRGIADPDAARAPLGAVGCGGNGQGRERSSSRARSSRPCPTRCSA